MAGKFTYFFYLRQNLFYIIFYASKENVQSNIRVINAFHREFFSVSSFSNVNRIQCGWDESEWFIHILIHFFIFFFHIKNDINIDVRLVFLLAIFLGNYIALKCIALICCPEFPVWFQLFNINCALNQVLYVQIKSMHLSVEIWFEKQISRREWTSSVWIASSWTNEKLCRMYVCVHLICVIRLIFSLKHASLLFKAHENLFTT